jgi:hypothetical protein
VLTPQEFDAHVRAAVDAQGRLRMPEQSMWEIFPFEPDSLVVKPLEPLVLPEPPRNGEGGKPCFRCSEPDAGVVWRNERWVLTGDLGGLRLPFGAMLMPREHLDLGDLSDEMAAEMGVLAVRITRAVEGLALIARVHMLKFGDGGSHLHLFLLGRPAGMTQLRGSLMTVWEEMLPPLPDGLAEETLQVAVDALRDLGA